MGRLDVLIWFELILNEIDNEKCLHSIITNFTIDTIQLVIKHLSSSNVLKRF